MVSPRSGKILVAFYTDFLPWGNFIIWAQNRLATQQMLRGRVHISETGGVRSIVNIHNRRMSAEMDCCPQVCVTVCSPNHYTVVRNKTSPFSL